MRNPANAGVHTPQALFADKGACRGPDREDTGMGPGVRQDDTNYAKLTLRLS